MNGSPFNRWLSTSRLVKPVIWLLWLAPLAWLIARLLTNQLGANPAEALIRSSGDWALRALLIALAVTPLRQWLGWTGLARQRRLLGLFAFFYALLHAVCYAWLDMGWNWGEIAADIWQRPFILVGVLTLMLLLALALTSPKAVLRALGGRRWQALHRLVHIAAWLAVLHFYWMRSGKNDVQEVGWYAAALLVLHGWRLAQRWRRTASPAN